MANTRSKGKETDKGQSSSARSRAGNPSSRTRNSDPRNSSSRNSTDSSPLRRSTRETPAKKVAQSSVTPKKPTGSTGKKNKLKKRKLSLSLSPSSGKKVSGGSSSSSKSSKKKSKGKKKVVVESDRNEPNKGKKDSDDHSNSNLISSGNESTKKRKRALLHAKAYAKSFKPQPLPKRVKLSEDQDPKEKETESDRNESNKAEKEITSHESPKKFVGETSKLRVQDSASSSSKSSEDEQSPSPSKERDISEKDFQPVDIQVLSVPAESRAAQIDCEILPLQTRVMPDVPTEKKKMEVCDDSQTDEQLEAFICCVCKRPTLLCCEGKGCKRSYHLTCLDPPIQDSPPGTWLCIACVKKKIQFGVYSISKGIESIWDVKEGGQSGKQYFVKYKNLAHVHNRWVSETEAFREAPELVSKFNWKIQKEKGQTTRWKQEWKEPERLLKRRALMRDETADEFFDGPADSVAYCNGEWLVKWKDLGYDNATWELENSEFLCKDDALGLIGEFEVRREQARRASDPESACRALEAKQAPLNKLEKLPDGFPPGLDNDHLVSTNKIREFWHKSRNAVFIDEQERLIKTITFIMSVIKDICRPILIVSNMTSLPLWESKFHRLAPNINVVTYTGSKKVRKLIQDVEFYEEGGCIMFQVLLSHPDAILEDFETIECVGWEAIIVDECQNFRMAKNLEKFKILSTDFRLLIFSSQLKDVVSEYINILSYLDPNNETSSPHTNDKEKEKNSMFTILKERFARHVAYECKPDSPKFVEYCVPVKMSNVQLELYASTLVSSSSALRSFSKIDHVGALRDTLLTLRKCCDHPYLVDQGLQGVLIEDRPPTEILNIGVRACGKLLLLDKLLKEMHSRGIRVLILFQSGGGSGRNQIGDFLDDFLRQRFGPDSYEHVEKGLLLAKRQTAINNFNDKSKGRFAFLIENRACLPSVKLSFIDAVLIYDSDWSPMNDLRALQRITIQPVPVLVPVFRLYSTCALEEKVLILAKQDVLLDSNLNGIAPSVSHSLLSWGAVNLFNSLNKPYCSDELISPDAVNFLDEVAMEILDKLSHRATNSRNLLVEAQFSGTTYSRNYSSKLEGEKAGVKSLEGDPTVFWAGLLEGNNNFQWRFVMAEPAQRSRRKVQLFDSLDKDKGQGVGENDEARKRRRRNGDDVGTVGTGSPRGRTGTALNVRNISCEELEGASVRATQAEAWVTEGTQKGLHLLLKPQLLNLCGVAGLPDYVKKMAEMLLEYVMNNFKVDPEPESILQAFVVSLCWRAASLFKHWLDVEELVSLASSFLRYSCERSHVESIYTRLKILKTQFKSQADEILTEWDPPVRSQNQLFRIPKQEPVNLQEPSSSQIQQNILNDQWQNQFEEPSSRQIQQNILNDQLQNQFEEPSSSQMQQNILNDQLQNQFEEPPSSQMHQNILHDRLQNQFEEPSSIQMQQNILNDRLQNQFEEPLSSQVQQNILNDQLQNQFEEPLSIQVQQNILNDQLQNQFDLIERVCARRQSAVLTKHRNELLEIEKYKEREMRFLTERQELTLKNLSWTSLTSDDTQVRNAKARFDRKMLAFEDHVLHQRERLEVAHARTSQIERNLRDEWVQNAKSGNLKEDFDNVPLPDFGFRIEEFIWVGSENVNNARNGERVVNEAVNDDETSNGEINGNGETDNNDETGNNRVVGSEEMVAEETRNEEIVNGETERNLPSEQLVNNGGADQSGEACEGNADTEQETPAMELIPPSIPLQAEPVPVIASVPIPTPIQVPHTNGNTAASTSNPTITPPQQRSAEQNSSTRAENGNGNISSETNNNSPLLQILPMASPMVFPQGLSPDPLRNELVRIKQQEDVLTKRYEYKKTEVEKEYAQELERVRKKYEEILNTDKSSFQQQKQLLGSVYKKLLINQSLAEEFRAKFIEHRGTSANNASSSSQSQGGRNPVPPTMPRPQQAQLPPRPHQNQMPLPPRQPYQIPLPHRPPHHAPQSTAPQQIRRPPTSSIPTSSTSNPTATSAPFMLPRVPSIVQVRPSTGPSITPSISQQRPSTTPSIPTLSAVRPLTGQNDTPLNLSQLNPVTLNSLQTGSATTSMIRAAPHLSRFRASTSSSANQSNPAGSSNVDRLRSMFASALGSASTSAGTSAGNGNVGPSGQRSNSPLVPQTDSRELSSSLLGLYINPTRRSTNSSISNNDNSISNTNNGVSNNNNGVNNGNNNNNGGGQTEDGGGVVCLSDDD
ncbi:hypothetical protein LUZ60_009395 [Juncus effusus]|nr:hypothetical protein LUZ60_009395 [Juncus effusus]